MASFAARILGGAGYAVFPSLPLEKCEGTERRTAHPIQSALDEARARLVRRARPAALHRGDFCPRGRNFRARTGRIPPP